MPFQSEKQRRYMHANLPHIANRWEKKYGLGGIAGLQNGGRIGFADGPEIPEKFLEDLKRKNLHKMFEEYRRWKEDYDRRKDFGVTQEAAHGGRIGFSKGSGKTYKDWLDYRIKEIIKGRLPQDFESWKKGEIKMNQGGFIPAHQAGVLGLAEGGSITKTPEGQTRGFVQARSDGRRPGYTEDDEDTGGMGHHGGGHGIGVDTVSSPSSNDRDGPAHLSHNAPKSTPTHTTDDSDDDDKAASYVNWNIQEKYTGDEDLEGQREIDRRNAITRLKHDPNLTKDERHGLEVGLGLRKPKQNTLMGNILKGVVTLATAGAGSGLFGKDLMKAAKLYQNFNKAKKIKTAWDEGEINLFGKKLDISNVKNKLTSDNQKLLASLPDGHPEKIALEAKMNIKTPPTDERDGSNIKIEEIETVNKTKAQMAKDEEYLKMQEAAYLAYLEQQRRRQVYLDNYRQMFLANKGGLAGLFRVKNT